jgi:sugar-specific transcriptional regulator TrmB
VIQSLIDIGLSKKEANAYIALLSHGTRTTSFIAKKADLNRGTAYVVLHSLLEKGLVVKSTKGSVQYFSALEPESLLSFLERREQKIMSQKRGIKQLVQELDALRSPLHSRPKMSYYEGVDGARSAYNQTLSNTEKVLSAFLSIADVGEFVGPEFLEDIKNRRVEAGIALNAIRTLEKDRKAMADNIYARAYGTSKRDLREVRYASEEHSYPCTMFLWDNKVLIMSSKEEGYAVIIESAELCDMQKKLFAMIWESLPKC